MRRVHAQSVEPAHQLHPHWDALLAHVGESMPSGGNWLRSWIAEMFFEPTRRIPAVVLIGPESSGKTTIHRAIGSLLPEGRYLFGTNDDNLMSHAAFGEIQLAAWESNTRYPWKRDTERLSKLITSREIVYQEEIVRSGYGRDHNKRRLNLIEDSTPLGQKRVPNEFHWIETRQGGRIHEVGMIHDRHATPASWEQRLRLRTLPYNMPQADWLRHLRDEQEAFLASLENREFQIREVA